MPLLQARLVEDLELRRPRPLETSTQITLLWACAAGLHVLTSTRNRFPGLCALFRTVCRGFRMKVSWNQYVEGNNQEQRDSPNIQSAAQTEAFIGRVNALDSLTVTVEALAKSKGPAAHFFVWLRVFPRSSQARASALSAVGTERICRIAEEARSPEALSAQNTTCQALQQVMSLQLQLQVGPWSLEQGPSRHQPRHAVGNMWAALEA